MDGAAAGRSGGGDADERGALHPRALAAPALWKVSDGRSDIYLFGTLHALRPDAQWRTPAYDAAYDRAQVVWFEADLDGADPKTVGA